MRPHKGCGRTTGHAGQIGVMPTLFRLLTIIAVIVGLVYGAMFALVTFVKPNTGEMTERVPIDRLIRNK